MKTIWVPSKRGIDIPADIYEAKGKCGLALLAHSFRSDRKEDGRYVKIGETLSENGILCLAMDFAGNGESKQPFEKYSLTSALADLEDCLATPKQTMTSMKAECICWAIRWADVSFPCF